jgi:hypothetical protein
MASNVHTFEPKRIKWSRFHSKEERGLMALSCKLYNYKVHCNNSYCVSYSMAGNECQYAVEEAWHWSSLGTHIIRPPEMRSFTAL